MPKLSPSITPLGERIVILPLEPEQVTAYGLIIPENAKGERPHQGTVLAVSESVKAVKVGQKVLFGRYAGDDIKLKGKDGKDVTVRVVLLESVLGIIS